MIEKWDRRREGWFKEGGSEEQSPEELKNTVPGAVIL